MFSLGGRCGGGAGSIIATIQHVGDGTTRTIEYLYDWRDRQEYAFDPFDASTHATFTRNYYDNLDRLIMVERYNDVTAETSSSSMSSSSILIARSETLYDDRGRVYQTKQYAVDPATGTVGNALEGNTWYDAAGNAVKQQPAGSEAFTKMVYDGMGRVIEQYTGYDTDESSYADALIITGDTIFEQTETTYDDAGNVIKAVAKQRMPSANSTTGALGDTGTQPYARTNTVGFWYDQVDRQTATADYGTGTLDRDTQTSAPSRSDTVLVSSTEFNSTGEAYKTIDPAGTESRQEYDDLGRVIKTIQNYVDGTPGPGSDTDVTVERTYNADGALLTLTAKNSTTGDQVTRYVYGTATGGGSPLIHRNDLLRAEIYPDPDDTTALGNGSDGVYDRVEYEYNRQGELVEMTDQNGTVHEYDYDQLGRLTQDRVTTVGLGIENRVLRVQQTYEVRGMLQTVTNYSNATVGSGWVLSEVKFVYNDFGQLETEYQDHDAVVNTQATPKVGYGYANGSNNHTRRTKITYPDGRELNFNYGDGGSAAENLGRIVDHRWVDYGPTPDVDAVRIGHGYDRAGNRLWREDMVADDNSINKDELYGYDGSYRLTKLERGDVTIGATPSISSKNFKEQWTLDPTGNWTGYKTDATAPIGATWDLEQTRSHNKANEITTIGATTGANWDDPSHDRAGNTIETPHSQGGLRLRLAGRNPPLLLLRPVAGARRARGGRLLRLGHQFFL